MQRQFNYIKLKTIFAWIFAWILFLTIPIILVFFEDKVPALVVFLIGLITIVYLEIVAVPITKKYMEREKEIQWQRELEAEREQRAQALEEHYIENHNNYEL